MKTTKSNKTIYFLLNKIERAMNVVGYLSNNFKNSVLLLMGLFFRKNKKEKRQTKKNPSTILIVTMSAGGGHIEAAQAKRAEFLEKYPSAFLIERTIPQEWKYPLLKHLLKRWDQLGAEDSLSWILFFCFQAWPLSIRLHELCLWLPCFIGAIKDLYKYDVDLIVDTQISGTHAIMKAMRIVQWWKNKTIAFEKIFIDLPTKDTKNFFEGIQQLSEKDKEYIQICTLNPLIEENLSEKDFWEKNCNLSINQVKYSPPPLQPTFLKTLHQQQKNKNKSFAALHIKEAFPSNISSLPLLYDQIFAFSPESAVKRSLCNIRVNITKKDKMVVLMLGSGPNFSLFLQYIQLFIEKLQEREKTKHDRRKDFLIILCGKNNVRAISFLEELLQYLQSRKTFPKRFSIIPLLYQNPKNLACIFHRCNATLTKSGGHTAHLLLSKKSGTFWIHQKLPEKNSNTSSVTKRKTKCFPRGMIFWEYGNARYLQKAIGAIFISIKTFAEITKDYFK